MSAYKDQKISEAKNLDDPQVVISDVNAEVRDMQDLAQDKNKVPSSLFGRSDAPCLPEGIVTERSDLNIKLYNIGDNIDKAFVQKQKRMEMFIKESLQETAQNIEQVWIEQQHEMQQLRNECTGKLESMFKQWHLELKKLGEQEDKLMNVFKQQGKRFKCTKVLQAEKLKIVKLLNDQFFKNLEDIENNSHVVFNQVKQVLNEEMDVLQKKIMGDN